MIKEIIIKLNNEESKYKALEEIHKQLKGNQDYIDSNIILNDDNEGSTDHRVNIYITEDVKQIPKIIL